MTRPNAIPVTSLRHLHASLDFYSPTGKANCIQRSSALALDLTGSEIVFATFRPATAADLKEFPNGSLVPFIHAWVEWRGWAYAPTTLERTNMQLVPWDRMEYRRINGATDVRVLQRSAFDRIARQFALSSAFKHARARAGVGDCADAMLRAAGVRYVLGAGRSVLPAGGR